MKGSTQKRGLLALFILIGAVAGSLIGDILGGKFKALQFLKTGYWLGFRSPIAIDLKIFTLTLGLSIFVNIMTIIGIILAIILYRKY